MSSTFASNVGVGNVVVFNGLLNLSSTGSGTPNPFDILVNVNNVFTYNPSLGDLLVDVRVFSSPFGSVFFDSTNSAQQTITRRLFASGNANATTGTLATDGLVTRFDFLPTANDDWYSINVTSTANPFRLETSTPADGSGQFANTLNPRIELYSPTDPLTPVATGTPFTTGNRNEFIQYQPLTTGDYRVRVTRETTTIGEYFLGFDAVAGPPRVIATNIPDNATLAPGSLTYQVTFSEPMNRGNLSADDVTLRGNFMIANHAISSQSFSADGRVLTINFAGLPDDDYTLTLTSGANGGLNFTDVAGNALDGEFTSSFPSGNGTAGGNFAIGFRMDSTAEFFPTTLDALPPLGGLAYDPAVTRILSLPGAEDNFTLNIDPGQSITVLVTGNSPALQPAVELRDPASTVLAAVTAPAAGRNALIQSVAATTGGMYTIRIADAGSTPGMYTVRVFLNTAVELASVGLASNKSRETAQSLDSSFTVIETPQLSATRTAVVGDLAVGEQTFLVADSGWWDSNGRHTAANDNYIVSHNPNGPLQFRNFLCIRPDDDQPTDPRGAAQPSQSVGRLLQPRRQRKLFAVRGFDQSAGAYWRWNGPNRHL
jgi:hypothetical protein